jgi:hypothetical protein
MLPLDASPFCHLHQPKPAALTAAELAESAGALSTPAEIHRFQSKVTLLLIQGRLTTKVANAYSYQVLTLLRGCREIAHHEKLQAELAEREAEQAEIRKVRSWSIPRPDRDDPPDPPAPETTSTDHPSAPPADPTSPLVGAGLARPLLDVAHTETHTNATRPTATDGEPARRSRALCGEGGSALTEQNPPKLKTPAKPPPPPPPPPPPNFYNHFHPIDPSLPPGAQDLSKSIPHPDAAECRRLEARRGLNFNRRRSQPVPRW